MFKIGDVVMRIQGGYHNKMKEGDIGIVSFVHSNGRDIDLEKWGEGFDSRNFILANEKNVSALAKSILCKNCRGCDIVKQPSDCKWDCPKRKELVDNIEKQLNKK